MFGLAICLDLPHVRTSVFLDLPDVTSFVVNDVTSAITILGVQMQITAQELRRRQITSGISLRTEHRGQITACNGVDAPIFLESKAKSSGRPC